MKKPKFLNKKQSYVLADDFIANNILKVNPRFRKEWVDDIILILKEIKKADYFREWESKANGHEKK